MPTKRIAGSPVATINTGGFFWSAQFSCADVAEDFFYWFDINAGTMFKASLPFLTGQATVTTLANFGDMKAMVPHPIDPSLMVYFNVTDGVNTVDTTTGEVVQLLTTTAFNALLNVGALEMANLTVAILRGTGIMLQSNTDPSGSIWQYDPVAGTAERLFVSNALGKLCEIGPDATNELILSGYGDPSNIIYSVDLSKSQVRVVAGIGTQDSITDGNALTTASFYTLTRIVRMAADLYYVLDTDFHVVRWIQGGQVGSYPTGQAGASYLCCALPSRNMLVSVGVQDVTVWA